MWLHPSMKPVNQVNNTQQQYNELLYAATNLEIEVCSERYEVQCQQSAPICKPEGSNPAVSPTSSPCKHSGKNIHT